MGLSHTLLALRLDFGLSYCYISTTDSVQDNVYSHLARIFFLGDESPSTSCFLEARLRVAGVVLGVGSPSPSTFALVPFLRGFLGVAGIAVPSVILFLILLQALLAERWLLMPANSASFSKSTCVC